MVIINAKVYTMAKEAIIENAFVKTNKGKITAIGKMADYKKDEGESTVTIDAKGLMLFPGFIDSHTHIGICEDSLGFEGDDLNEMTNPTTPQMRGLDAVNPFDECFKEALESGITSLVTGPGSANPISGQLFAMKTYGTCVDEMTIKAPIAMKFALGENPKSVYNDRKESPITRMATAALIRYSLNTALQYKQKKDDGEDIDFDDSCEALLPLLSKEIPAHIHAHRLDDISTATRIAKEFDLDYIIVHATQAYLAPEVLSKNNVKVMCGPLICDRSKPELKGLTPETPGILNKNNVPLSIVTDHPVVPIQYLNICAGLACREGLPYLEALKAITINPAKFSGIDDRVGSVEVGKDADFVLFADDPLSLYSKPEMVIIDGQVRYSKQA